MEDAVQAFIMAFSVLVFILGLTVSVKMFSEITNTADTLLFYADKTNYYDNIEIEGEHTEREVDIDTIIPILYRYYKENFCVKIYDADNNLIQLFDVNLEGEVRKAAAATRPTSKQKALNQLYNDKTNRNTYLFEAPWIGSTEEHIKTRVDYFVNGKAGYINNTYVNYEENKFSKIREYNRTATDANKIYFEEKFINYSYTGDTITNEEGEILIIGVQPKDKIIITYTATKNP